MALSTSSSRILLAAVALTLAVVAWTVVLRPRGRVNGQYFYDLSTNELYVESLKAMPPVKRPSGGEAVLAVVMSCGSCDKKDDRYTAYLEKYSPEYHQVMASGQPPTPQQMQSKSLIRAADGGEWLPASAVAAQQIMNAAQTRCGQGSPQYCTP